MNDFFSFNSPIFGVFSFRIDNGYKYFSELDLNTILEPEGVIDKFKLYWASGFAHYPLFSKEKNDFIIMVDTKKNTKILSMLMVFISISLGLGIYFYSGDYLFLFYSALGGPLIIITGYFFSGFLYMNYCKNKIFNFISNMPRK